VVSVIVENCYPMVMGSASLMYTCCLWLKELLSVLAGNCDNQETM